MSEPLDDRKRMEIEERVRRCSSIPWVELSPFTERALAACLTLLGGPPPCTVHDLSFLLHARDDIPALLGEIDRLERKLDADRLHAELLSLRCTVTGKELTKEIVEHRGLSWSEAEQIAISLVQATISRKDSRRAGGGR